MMESKGATASAARTESRCLRHRHHQPFLRRPGPGEDVHARASERPQRTRKTHASPPRRAGKPHRVRSASIRAHRTQRRARTIEQLPAFLTALLHDSRPQESCDVAKSFPLPRSKRTLRPSRPNRAMRVSLQMTTPSRVVARQPRRNNMEEGPSAGIECGRALRGC